MAYLRETLNHTFLRTVYNNSSKQAKLEYQEVQRNFTNDHINDDPVINDHINDDPVINDHINDDPDDEPAKFTALDIINYIESDCICSNGKALQGIHNSISEMVRYNYQTLLD